MSSSVIGCGVAVAVGPAAAGEQALDDRARSPPPPRRERSRLSSCSTASSRRPVPHSAGRVDALALEPGDGLEAAVVHRARDELADVRVHAPGRSRKTPRSGRHGVALAEQVLEHRGARAARVCALADMRELLGVAEQHDAARRLGHRERVGERHLPRLVDDQDVDRRRASSSRAHSHAVPAMSCDRAVVVARRESSLPVDASRCRRAFSGSSLDLLPAAERAAASSARVLDLGEQVVDRLVRRRRDADPHAVAQQVDGEPRAGLGLARARADPGRRARCRRARATCSAKRVEVERLAGERRRPRAIRGGGAAGGRCRRRARRRARARARRLARAKRKQRVLLGVGGRTGRRGRGRAERSSCRPLARG